MSSHAEPAKAFYQAFSKADREFVENLLTSDFIFSSPPDPLLDRNGFFEKCWPGAGILHDFEFIRVVEHDNEVIVTYEFVNADGTKGRNTEVLTFTGDKISRSEVYFGWDVKE